MSIGYTFPFIQSSGSVGFLQSTDDVITATSQNLKSVISTNWGERPHRYGFGCNLREFLFDQDVAVKQKVADRIMTQVGKFLPYVLIEDLFIETSADDKAIKENSFRIQIRFSIRGRAATGVITQMVNP